MRETENYRGAWRCGQTNANLSLLELYGCQLRSTKAALFLEISSDVQLEEVSGGENVILIEEVPNRGTQGCEYPNASHVLEA